MYDICVCVYIYIHIHTYLLIPVFTVVEKSAISLRSKVLMLALGSFGMRRIYISRPR